AGELVDCPLETVDPVGENLEVAVHDPIPRLRIDLLAEVHRSLHVSEEHRHLLPLAFESGARCQDLFGEMFRRVGAGIRWRSWLRSLRERLPAITAESLSWPVLRAARAARERQLRAALGTEFPALAIVATAA